MSRRVFHWRATIACRHCAHSKAWHKDEAACLYDGCDCPFWDYGAVKREDR